MKPDTAIDAMSRKTFKLQDTDDPKVKDVKVKPDRLVRASGSDDSDFGQLIPSQLLQTFWFGDDTSDKRIELVVGTCMASLEGIAPKSEIEGMYATQIVACHQAAIECMRRAMLPDISPDNRSYNLTQANRLMRSYATLVGALDKHRGKGQQKVIVEHVHVHEGGQAIVGNIEQTGGSKENGAQQSHAQTAVTHAPEPEMRSTFEKVGEAVPLACNG